jgi:hypothetical protein
MWNKFHTENVAYRNKIALYNPKNVISELFLKSLALAQKSKPIRVNNKSL